MPFPAEMITMFGSTIVGWGLSITSKLAEQRARREELLITKGKEQAAIYSAARKYSNKGFQFTRRFIAVAAVLSIVVWPKIVSVFWPDIPVVVSWTEIRDGFLFFSNAKEVLMWKDMHGLVMTPLDTNLMTAIIGLFFGNQLAKT